MIKPMFTLVQGRVGNDQKDEDHEEEEDDNDEDQQDEDHLELPCLFLPPLALLNVHTPISSRAIRSPKLRTNRGKYLPLISLTWVSMVLRRSGFLRRPRICEVFKN